MLPNLASWSDRDSFRYMDPPKDHLTLTRKTNAKSLSIFQKSFFSTGENFEFRGGCSPTKDFGTAGVPAKELELHVFCRATMIKSMVSHVFA